MKLDVAAHNTAAASPLSVSGIAAEKSSFWKGKLAVWSKSATDFKTIGPKISKVVADLNNIMPDMATTACDQIDKVIVDFEYWLAKLGATPCSSLTEALLATFKKCANHALTVLSAPNTMSPKDAVELLSRYKVTGSKLGPVMMNSTPLVEVCDSLTAALRAIDEGAKKKSLASSFKVVVGWCAGRRTSSVNM